MALLGNWSSWSRDVAAEGVGAGVIVTATDVRVCTSGLGTWPDGGPWPRGSGSFCGCGCGSAMVDMGPTIYNLREDNTTRAVERSMKMAGTGGAFL